MTDRLQFIGCIVGNGGQIGQKEQLPIVVVISGADQTPRTAHRSEKMFQGRSLGNARRQDIEKAGDAIQKSTK